jgi:hypothetical protein
MGSGTTAPENYLRAAAPNAPGEQARGLQNPGEKAREKTRTEGELPATSHITLPTAFATFPA